jgi:predicted N-formylglutamate amidohydrolase
MALLGGDDPLALTVLGENSRSPFFIVCDHAGNRIPKSLGSLGVSEAERQRHIAWDIGVAGTARFMAESLDAFTVLQTYSRLVIDCNRPLTAPDSIARVSEHTVIPGNQQLTPAESAMRADEIFTPYHRRIAAELDRREANKVPTLLVALHSFTPVYKSSSRPWHIGILYHRDDRAAKLMLNLLRQEDGLVVGDNEPYSVSDETDYSVPIHGETRGLPHVEIELRQDLIGDEAGQRSWAQRLCRILPAVWYTLSR